MHINPRLSRRDAVGGSAVLVSIGVMVEPEQSTTRSSNMKRTLALFAALMLIPTVAACTAEPTTESPTPSSPALAAEGGVSVDIGDGRTIWLNCARDGSGPTIILESGYHDGSDIWFATHADGATPVFDQLVEDHRVCAWDRPGTLRYLTESSSISDRTSLVDMPRTAADVVNDLHTVLDVAGEEGPYVLAAHSLGGLFARLYAQTHPDQVAGLVFVDSFPIEMPYLMGDTCKAYSEVLSSVGGGAEPGYELIDVDASIEQVKNGEFPPIPIAVISKTEPFGGLPETTQGFRAAGLEAAWLAGEQYLVDLRPNTPHILVTGSDHYVQAHQPDLIVAITEMVAKQATAR